MKFAKGDRVQLSNLAMAEHNYWRQFTATVVGFSRDGRCSRVLADGNKPTSSQTYHNDFLTLATAKPAAEPK